MASFVDRSLIDTPCCWNVEFAGKFLEGLSLGLRDEERSKDTSKHESRVDLHNMIKPRAGIFVSFFESSSSERGNSSLCNDRANLSRTSRDTVGGGTVSGWETLAGNNEGGGIGAKVEKELDQDVNAQHAMG